MFYQFNKEKINILEEMVISRNESGMRFNAGVRNRPSAVRRAEEDLPALTLALAASHSARDLGALQLELSLCTTQGRPLLGCLWLASAWVERPDDK